MSSCLDRGVSDEVGGVVLLAGQAAVDYTMMLLMVLGNTFIVASVCRYRRHYPAHGTGASARFAANLALADTYVAVASSYFLAFRYFCWAQETLGSRRFTCVLRFFLISSGHMTSAFSLGAIAVDRYVAVMHALQYRKIMNPREAMAVKKRRCSDESQQVCADGGHQSVPRAINTKSARIVLYVTGVYVFCWSPYTILYIIKSCGYSSPEINVAHRLCLSFGNINYLVNPFLYSWNNSGVRKSIISSLKCLGVLRDPKNEASSRTSSSRISNAVPNGASLHCAR